MKDHSSLIHIYSASQLRYTIICCESNITMKAILIVALCLTTVLAVPEGPSGKDIQIVESTYDNKGDGNYDFNYKDSVGSARDEHGEIKSVQGEKEQANVVVMRGSYSWKSPEGKEFTVNWVSDEKGYRATGDHIPKTGKSE